MRARVRLPGAFDRIVVSSRGSRLDSTSVSPREGSRTSRRPATRRDDGSTRSTSTRTRTRRTGTTYVHRPRPRRIAPSTRRTVDARYRRLCDDDVRGRSKHRRLPPERPVTRHQCDEVYPSTGTSSGWRTVATARSGSGGRARPRGTSLAIGSPARVDEVSKFPRERRAMIVRGWRGTSSRM